MNYFTIPVNRKTAEELDKASADLEKRGFELVRRGASSSTIKEFTYRENRGPKKRFTGDTDYEKHTAIMRRLQPCAKEKSNV